MGDVKVASIAFATGDYIRRIILGFTEEEYFLLNIFSEMEQFF